MAPATEPKRPGAYAVSTESKGEPQFFSLTVPAGVQPGSTFTFVAGERRSLTARCPPTSKPGDSLQVALSPEPETHYTQLKMAPLTSTLPSGGGGAKPMLPHIRQTNHEFLEEISNSFVTTVPANVQPGQQFVAQTPRGERFLVTCPPNVGPNQRLRIRAPEREQPQQDDTKIFQVKAPEGAMPNQVLPVLVCGKLIPVTLPSTVVPGQMVTLKLPTEQVVSSIELAYDEKSSKGWCRTIRMSDMKFQWVHVDLLDDAEPESDNKAVNAFKPKNTAFVRRLTYLDGNDSRMRTGTVELVPAKEAVADSELRHHHRTLVSYASVAHIQTQSFDDKMQWFHKIAAELTSPWESGRIKILVRREQLLNDSLRAIMSLSRADMRKRWRIEFIGEPAIDSGGVMREWFELITDQLFNPDLGLWLPSVNNQICMRINPASDISNPDDHLIQFRFLGRVMGRAMFDRQLVKGHMVRHLYKHLLGWPITFEDLQSQDEEYYQSLKNVANVEDVSALCLDFTLAEDIMGIKRNVELVPGGTQIEVMSENLPQYLEAILKYRTLERTKLQITELMLGFFDIIPEPALTVFDPNELELLLCGVPTIDIDDWQNNTIYRGKCDENEQVVQWFWEIVRDDLDQEFRARLLQFVTGTSGVPARGFSVLQGNDGNIKKFCIHGVARESYVYPRSHTCFNRIDLPIYTSKTELLDKLKAAITFSAVGFDIE